MRIGIDARFLGPKHGGGGIGRYVEELLRALAPISRAHDFVLFTHPEGEAVADFLPKNWSIQTVHAPWYSLAEQFEMPRAFAKAKLDLVHVPHFNVPLCCPVPFIATIHDLILFEVPESAHATTLGPIRYGAKRMALRAEFRHVAKNAAHIIVPSAYTKNSLIRRFPNANGKITVISEGMNRGACGAKCAASTPRFDADYPELLYVGSSYPHKNLTRLLIAFTKIRKRIPRATLHIVSRADKWLLELQAHAKTLNIEDAITWSTFLPEEKLHEAYRSATCFVFPTLLEGFGLPPLEAMLHRLPVVASNTGPLPEILGNAAWYFNPRDEKDMAETIAEVITDKELWKTLQDASRPQAEAYDWTQAARATLAAYEAVTPSK